MVKDFVGSYSGYRQYLKDREEERRAEAKNAAKGAVSAAGVTSPANSWKGERKPKLSYKEKMEKEQLEKDIAALEEEKKALEARLCSGTLPSDQLTSDSVRIGEVTRLLDEKELRWLELDEIG